MGEVSELLAKILDLLGYEAVDVTGDGISGTGLSPEAVTEKSAVPNLETPSRDRSDRCDRDSERTHEVAQRRGRFTIGGTYRIARVERFYAVSEQDRPELDEAGFARAGIIVVEGVSLLVADAARAFADNVIFVIGFADTAPRSSKLPTRAKSRR